MNDNEEDIDYGPSKTQLKREMEHLQALGSQLVKLPEKALAEIELEETLLDAIMLARRLKNREGLRRQLQYIGKLMRNAEVEPIADYLERRAGGHQEKVQEFHALEVRRDQLIAGPDSLIEECLSDFPGAERSRLRQLVRSARKEKQSELPPKAARKLFKYLRELNES